MKETSYLLRCLRCGTEYPPSSAVLLCAKCQGELSVIWDLEAAKTDFAKGREYSRYGVWGYSSLLPVFKEEHRVSLSEGGTPLVRSASLGRLLGLRNLYMKNETQNPTASFKDRGISVAVSKAVEFGVKDVACASTGNLAASVAAYCARAGITAHIYLPEVTPKSKIVQVQAYGASVHFVDGNTTDSAGRVAMEESRRRGWYAMRSNPKWNPYPMEGTKTIAMEVCEQLGWKSPDFVLTGVGSGTNLSGNWKGFREFNELGLVDSLPAMVGVQSDGCMPFVDAVERGLDEEDVEPWPGAKTIASGLADAYPNACLQGLAAVRESKGTAVAVSDKELIEATLLLAKHEGIFAEPSAAAGIAALRHLRNDGILERDDVVVCEVTGSGLKQTAEIAEFMARAQDKRPGRA